MLFVIKFQAAILARSLWILIKDVAVVGCPFPTTVTRGPALFGRAQQIGWQNRLADQPLHTPPTFRFVRAI